MPLVPGDLARAEDLNTTLDDIAVALTNSVAADGSTALTGALNANGQNIGGVNTLSAVNLEATTWVTGTYLNITSNGTIETLQADTAGVNGLTATYLNVTNTGTIAALAVVNLGASGEITTPYLDATSGTVVANSATINNDIVNNFLCNIGTIYNLDVIGTGTIANAVINSDTVNNLLCNIGTIYNLTVTGTATGPFMTALEAEIQELRDRIALLEARRAA